MKVDFSQAALNIRSSGLSLQAASKMLGWNRGKMAQIARGEVIDPGFHAGIELLDLHFDRCGDVKTRELLK